VPISTALVVGFGGLMLVALVTVMAIGLGVAGRNTLGLLVDKAALTLDLVTLRVEARMEPVGDQAAFLAEEIANGTLSPERSAELAAALRLALAATPQVTGIAFTGPDYRTVRVGRFGAGYETMIGDARMVEDAVLVDRFLAEARARRAPYWADPYWQPQLEATLIPLVQPVRQAENVQQLLGPRHGVALAAAGDDLRNDDVLQGRELGKKVMELIDEPHVQPPHAGSRVVAACGARSAGEIDFAPVRFLEQAGNVQERRLARARGADKRHDFPFMHLQVDAAEDLERRPPLSERADESGQPDHRLTHIAGLPPGRSVRPATTDTTVQGRSWSGLGRPLRPPPSGPLPPACARGSRSPAKTDRRR
jgi:hypothetical protein